MYRVLIVDDEDNVRSLLVKSVRNSKLEVETAEAGDGKEALSLAALWRPDILITDIAMPFMNGLELIKEMQKAGISSKNVVISGYDEFDYARQAISLGVKDYLLKPFLPKEFVEVLGKMVKELDSQKALLQNMSLLKEQAKDRAKLARERALKGLLKGKECPKEQKEAYESLGIELKGSSYAAGVMRFTGGSFSFETQEQVEEFLMLIRDGYFPSKILMYAVSFDGLQLAVIWCGEAEKESFLQMIRCGLEKIRESLERYYHTSLTCAVGGACEAPESVEGSYREAMAVWRGTLNEDPPIRFFGEEKRETEESAASQIREWKNQIRLLAGAGRKAEADLALLKLMKCYASYSNKKNDYISVSIGELIYALQNDMEQKGIEIGEPEGLSSLQDRISYGSLVDMKEMLEQYIETCCRAAAEHSEETKAFAAVKQIRLLIETNLRRGDMDLLWVAEQVHFSSSYVRQIFKKYVGESVGEYLIRKRMEHAGMLLQKTGLKIQEIAAECGYDNQRYFASSFKKFYGCTPTEFKKAVEEEQLY